MTPRLKNINTNYVFECIQKFYRMTLHKDLTISRSFFISRKRLNINMYDFGKLIYLDLNKAGSKFVLSFLNECLCFWI